jgi:hypothetical protein
MIATRAQRVTRIGWIDHVRYIRTITSVSTDINKGNINHARFVSASLIACQSKARSRTSCANSKTKPSVNIPAANSNSQTVFRGGFVLEKEGDGFISETTMREPRARRIVRSSWFATQVSTI